METIRQVTLDGGLPWGFRIQGGKDTGLPLRIARVNPGSKASLQGIREGDAIVSINGKETENLTNSQAHGLLKDAGNTLCLSLAQGSGLSKKMFKSSVNADVRNNDTKTSGSETATTQSDAVSSTSKSVSTKATVEEGVTSFCGGNDHESKENSLLGEIEAALGMGLYKHDDGASVISTAYTASSPKPGVWSPGQSDSIKSELTPEKDNEPKNNQEDKKEAPPPVWTPSVARSPSVERKEFRPVRLDTGSLRKQVSQDPDRPPAPPRAELSYAWQTQDGPGSASSAITSPTSEYSFLTTSASTFLPGFNDERRPSNVSTNSTALSTPAATPTSHLPRAPNPTVTLLQKAREGSLPKGSAYLDSVKQEEPRKLYRSPFETVYTVKREYESEDEEKRKIIELAPKKFPGIGPTTNEGIPVALRTGINEENQHQWYRRMYDSLHRQGRPEDYVTVRYKTNRGRGGGYLSEPEPCDYDSDAGRYATLDRRRNRLREYESSNTPTRITHGHDTYRVQPGRIENYEPGRSSVVQHETKQVQKQISTIERPFVGRSLKESGYESDSQLVFRRRTDQGDPANDPREQKAYYRDIQRGGEVPLQGLRKPLPEKPKVEPQPEYFGVGGGYIQNAPGSVHKFSESEVTIGYKSPIRNLQNVGGQQQEMEEEELRLRQADHMRRVYEQERRRKLLQELEDLESRRHMDNFTPSQKSPIPLNRYDTVLEEPVRFQQQQQQRDRTPEPKIVAKALYNFVAMNARELSFHKGDIIFVRRQIDKNWYEGEHNATVGIFPVNYVEIVPYDGVRMAPKKPTEVQAKVKHSFNAQSPAELSLVKGELLIVTRQIDDNWFEGRIGNRKGIFPAAYVEILQTPTLERQLSKPSAQPVSHSLITNGSLRNTPNPHHLQQQTPYQQQQQQQQKYSTAPRMGYSAPAEQSGYRQGYQSMDLMQNQGHLHVDTQSAGPVLYRALYPYVPQNDDELELQEGDTVCVLEKCDDGWYVGNSQRTGHFGTFPGNYVQRI